MDSTGSGGSLSPADRSKIDMFKEICGVQDDNLACMVMIQHNYNVEAAVNTYLAGFSDTAFDASTTTRRSHSTSSSSASSGNSSAVNPLVSESHRSRRPANSNANVSGSSRSTPRSTRSQEQEDHVDYIVPARNALLDSLLYPLRWLLSAQQNFHTPDQDARKFVSEFESCYGTTHPTFQAQSYEASVRQAFQQGRFLLVYLHSRMHDDTASFCRLTLCKDAVSRVCDASMITWAGKVEDVEGFSLSERLQVHTYPFMALLVCKSEREVTIADRIQGTISETALLERLQNVQLAYQSYVQRVQLEQRRRSESISLREEQDRAYRESELQDLRRQQEKERIEKLHLQEEAEAAERAAALAQAEAEAQREKVAEINKKRSLIKDEPPAGESVSTIRFQLPSGIKITRRFRKDDTVRVIFDYLDVYFADSSQESVTHYSVSTSYPKVELKEMSATVESCGLHPKGMLFVHDLDL
jgi:FAS-associated factor 2